MRRSTSIIACMLALSQLLLLAMLPASVAAEDLVVSETHVVSSDETWDKITIGRSGRLVVPASTVLNAMTIEGEPGSILEVTGGRIVLRNPVGGGDVGISGSFLHFHVTNNGRLLLRGADADPQLSGPGPHDAFIPASQGGNAELDVTASGGIRLENCTVTLRGGDGADLPASNDTNTNAWTTGALAGRCAAGGNANFSLRTTGAAGVYIAGLTLDLDGGDGGVEADERDRIFTLKAPFDGEPESLMTLAQRYGGVTWGNGDLAFVTSWWWKTRNLKVWRIKPDDRGFAPAKVQDRSWQDRYADPGAPIMHYGKFGRNVILTADGGDTIFLIGDGASDEGDRPFLDTYSLETGETSRLFRSEAPYFERPVELVDVKKRLVLTRRESQTDPPNYWLRDLKKDALEQKTFFPDPNPQLAGISKELITYERNDGVTLTGTLYLPAGYDKDRDGPLPMLMWAYPTEFKSKQDAGQVTDSPYRFTRVWWGSPMLYLTQGYAVLDDPTMPIVGEGDVEPNDTFIEQLVGSAQAAIDEVVRRGVADRDRIAIGGHSYGAFMTGNLLAHSDLFRLGLPRSGAYNRTLTPFGFQAEERTLWEAPEIYFQMSPFMHADKINEPILLVHGEADNNSGTFPMQSERMYGALKGHGATVRLVMLPHESHGYRARESIMHLLWETTTWLDRYVKDAEPRTLEAQEVEGS